MSRVVAGDIVLLNDGQKVEVIQAAQFDSVFQYRNNDTGNSGWTDSSLVEWNYTLVEWATKDSEIQQDFI